MRPRPLGGASGASGQSSGTTPTITLSDLKTKIAANDSEIAAGGGSEAYKDCLHRKLERAREVQYRVGPDGSYFYKRHDAALGSGLAKGTMAFTDPTGSVLPSTPPPTPRRLSAYRQGRGIVHNEMAGELRTRCAPYQRMSTSSILLIDQKNTSSATGCPSWRRKRQEVFVTVTAPTGTLHEAFFDPVAIGTTIGADGTNGVLKPNTRSRRPTARRRRCAQSITPAATFGCCSRRRRGFPARRSSSSCWTGRLG